MSTTISSALLAAACGFGATVWFVTAHYSRRVSLWHSIWYTLLGVSYLVVGVLLMARIIGRPFTPTPLFSLVLLAVIFIVPPALQLAGHLKARTLIDQQRANHE